MNRGGSVAYRLGIAPSHLIAAGVVAGFGVTLLAVTYLGLPIWSLIVPVVGTMYAFLVIHRPIVGLFMVICTFFLPVQLGGVTLLQALGVVTAGMIMIWFLIQRRPIVLGNIVLPLFLLGLLILVSFFFTRDVDRTTHYMRQWTFNMFFALLLINVITRFDQLRQVIWAILLMAVVNAVAGMIEFASNTEAFFRAAGLLENANQFGNLAALAFPLAFYQYLYRSGPIRWFALALSGVCVGGVIASVSRGAVIALILVFCVILVTERRRVLALGLVVGIAVVVIPFLPGYFLERAGNLASDMKGTVYLSESESLTVRGHFNKGGLRIWRAHPVLGVGLGNFGLYFVEQDFNSGLNTQNTVPPHNIYLQALVETGLVGFAVLVWLILVTLRNVVRARRLSRDDLDRWLYFGGVEMMALCFLISSFSTGNIMGEYFWLLVCLPGVSSRVAAADEAGSLAPQPIPGTEQGG